MKLLPLPALAAVLALAASCTSGTSGIFASIEREQAIVSNGGLSKTATITTVAQLNGTVNKYFATGGKSLFTRSTDPTATAWTATTVKGNSQVTSVGSTADPTQTAPVSPASYTPHAVYAVAGGTLWVTTDGDNWGTPVFASGSGSLGANDVPATLVPIVRADGYTSTDLVLVTGNSTLGVTDSDGAAVAVYPHVYVIQGGSTDTLVGPLNLTTDGTTIAGHQLAAAVDDGTNYWLLDAASLWKAPKSGLAASTLNASTTWPSSVSPKAFLSLIDVNGTFFLGTNVNTGSGGSIYSTNAPDTGSSWTAITNGSAVTTSTGSYPVSFGCFLLNPQTGHLWVGSASSGNSVVGNGYMEITGLGGTPALNKGSVVDSNVDNYSSSSLSTQFVGSLFWGTNQDGTHNLFLGTMAFGLWSWAPSTEKWSQQ